MRKPILLAFLGLSCMLGPPPPPPPVAGMRLDPAVKGLAYDTNPGGTVDFDVTVDNTGDFAFDWDIFPESAWLTCVPDTGSLLETESAVVTVTIDFDHGDFVDGLNATNLRVEWGEGADRYIRVSVYIDGTLGWIVVDGVDGDDDTGDGTVNTPYKTITKGLAEAASAEAVVCLPATYAEPVTLGEGLTLVGTGPQGCVIDAGTGPSVTAGDLITNATTLSGFTVTGDNPAGTEGAAMTCEGSPVVTDCEFSSCRGSENAAVFIKGDSGATFSDCVVKSNSGCYGIACLDNSSPTISNCEISNNRYSGVWCGGDSTPTVQFCQLTSNNSSGIFVVGYAQPVIDANTFDGNVQGMALSGDSFSVIVNNVVTDCQDYAGIASEAQASAVLTNNTIAYNAEGIWWGSSSPWSIENNIIFYNTVSQWSRFTNPDDPPQDSPLPDPYAYNAIQNVSTADGVENIWFPPSFADASARDLRLVGSQCVNSGDNNAAYLPAHDRDNNARILGAQVDRGAYEFVE